MVGAGKHVYLEKPVAVDVPGALKVMEIGKRAEGKLSLDVGFQIRDCPPFVEMVRRIHAGALGKIVCGEAYYLTGYIDRPAWPNASPAERRLRNWVHDRVLSGDIIVEQNIHVIDICNWILKGHPLKASGTGGRQGRPADDGDAFGNYNVVFHYPEGVDVTFSSTPICERLRWDVTERFFPAPKALRSHLIPAHWASGATNRGKPPVRLRKTRWSLRPFRSPEALRPILEFADTEKKKAFVEEHHQRQFP